MNTYPFAGEIKMFKVIKDGKEVIEWEQVDMSKHADGNLGIGTPSQVKWEPAPLQLDRFNVDPVTGNVGIGTPSQEPMAFSFSNATEWARIDKDMNVVHLDMELCAKGPHNAYTALAMAIWNKAIETERNACAKVCDDWPNGRDDVYSLAVAIRARSKCERGDAGTKISEEISCKTHPDAPHGFDRNMSHTLDRYVCECEHWEPSESWEHSK